jgi:hypothetical protein
MFYFLKDIAASFYITIVLNLCVCVFSLQRRVKPLGHKGPMPLLSQIRGGKCTPPQNMPLVKL